MKKQSNGLSNNTNNAKPMVRTQKQRYFQTGAVLFIALAVIAGIYLAAAWARSSSLVSSAGSSASQSLDPESSEVSSDSISSIPTPTPTPVPTPTTAPTPTPTKAPTSGPSTGVSTVRDGWWYSPGKTGAPSTTSTAHVSVCDRYDGIWQADTTKKTVYITMDCGYDYNGNTEKILDIAKKYDFKITFFVTGAMFETPALKALVLRMVNEGHLVGNHTWNHPSLPTLLNEKGAAAVNAEMDKVEAAFKALTGKTSLPT